MRKRPKPEDKRPPAQWDERGFRRSATDDQFDDDWRESRERGTDDAGDLVIGLDPDPEPVDKNDRAGEPGPLGVESEAPFRHISDTFPSDQPLTRAKFTHYFYFGVAYRAVLHGEWRTTFPYRRAHMTYNAKAEALNSTFLQLYQTKSYERPFKTYSAFINWLRTCAKNQAADAGRCSGGMLSVNPLEDGDGMPIQKPIGKSEPLPTLPALHRDLRETPVGTAFEDDAVRVLSVRSLLMKHDEYVCPWCPWWHGERPLLFRKRVCNAAHNPLGFRWALGYATR